MSSSDLAAASNATQPLSSYEDIALQELWARIIAALGDTSLLTTRPKTSSSPSRKPSTDDGDVFGDHIDVEKRRLHRMTRADYRNTLYMYFQGADPDWLLSHTLRANRHDAEASLRDVHYHLSWRKHDMNVDSGLLRSGEPGFVRTINTPTSSKRDRFEAEGFMNILQNGTCQILRGLDRQKRLIMHIRVRLHKAYYYPNNSYRSLSAYFSEYCRLQMAGDIDSAILLFDLGDAGLLNMDDRPLRNFIETARNLYPQGLGDVIMHRMPKSYVPIWRLAKYLIKSEFVEHIHFTRTLEDLEKFIPLEVIPADLGGGDDFVYRYEEPDQNDPTNGGGGDEVQASMTTERERLMEERRQIGDTFIDMTKRWIEIARSGKDASEAHAMRKKVSEELVANYWRLDPYTRARSIWDKFGMLPQPEVDLSKLQS